MNWKSLWWISIARRAWCEPGLLVLELDVLCTQMIKWLVFTYMYIQHIYIYINGFLKNGGTQKWLVGLEWKFLLKWMISSIYPP